MDSLHRLFRIALMVPLAFAGTLAVLAAQSTIILSAVCFGMVRPAIRKRDTVTYDEAPPQAVGPVDRPPNGAADVSFLPLRAINPESLVLLANEECYLQESARLIVQGPETHWLGGLGGFSIGRRVVRNPSSDGRRGKLRTQSLQSDGRLYVTNSRIVFTGGPVTVNMHVAQILTLDPTPTGVSLSFVNEQPMEFITGNPRLGVTLRKIVYRTSEPEPSR
jgi:hypothetical protein